MPERPYGPDNPHPLSALKTELVWEGKYDEYGNRRGVDTAGMAMPRRRAETSGRPALFKKETKGRKRDDFRNRYVWMTTIWSWRAC